MPLLDLSAPLHTTTQAAPPAPVTPITRPAPTPSCAATDLLATPGAWDWQALRDYVLRQMAERRIEHPRIATERLNSVFRSFHQRWGNQAERIARFAFEHLDGYWMDAPITPARFTKGNDPYFAQRIADSLLTQAA